MSRDCQHDVGSDCIICDKRVNWCCGDDKQCDKCLSSFCWECYNEKTVVVETKQCKDADYQFKCSMCKKYSSRNTCGTEVETKEFQCPRCSAEIVTDEDLIRYFLTRYKITRDVAEERYRKWNKKQNTE